MRKLSIGKGLVPFTLNGEIKRDWGIEDVLFYLTHPRVMNIETKHYIKKL